jgi:hypothetical protein
MDTRLEILKQLAKDDKALLNLCYADKTMYKSCSSKATWSYIFSHYNLPMPKISFSTPQRWLDSFKMAYNIASFAEQLMTKLHRGDYIVHAYISMHATIIPYDVFNIEGVDIEKIYNELQHTVMNRLNAIYVKSPSFKIKYKNNKYHLNMKFYLKEEDEEDEGDIIEESYILTENATAQLLYNCLYHGLLLTNEKDVDDNYETYTFDKVI